MKQHPRPQHRYHHHSESVEKKARERAVRHGSFIFGFAYTLVVLLATIPVWVALQEDGLTAEVGIQIIKSFALLFVLARPFTMLLYQGQAAWVFLEDTVPGLSGAYSARYPEIANFQDAFVDFAHGLPVVVFALPLLFLVVGAFYAGYRTPEGTSVKNVALRFVLKNYLGRTIAFAAIFGVVGIVFGAWGVPTLLGYVLVGVASGWIDLVLWIVVSLLLVGVGKYAHQKRVERRPAAEHLIEALHKNPLVVPPPTVASSPAAGETPYRGPPATPVPAATPQVGSPSGPSSVVETPRRAFCEFCGTKLHPSTQYCPGCGVYLEPVPVAPRERPPATATPAVPKAPEISPEPSPESSPEPSPEPRAYHPRVDEVPGVSEFPGAPAAAEARRKAEKVHKLETALARLNEFSVAWAAVFIGFQLLGAFSQLFWGGSLYGFLAAVLVVPFGVVALTRDRDIYGKWVHEHNYSSRGVDLILWGLVGMVCGAAGLLLFVKGVLVLLITQEQPEIYPRLDATQWQARVFQASNTAAGPLVLLATVAGLANFALSCARTSSPGTWKTWDGNCSRWASWGAWRAAAACSSSSKPSSSSSKSTNSASARTTTVPRPRSTPSRRTRDRFGPPVALFSFPHLFPCSCFLTCYPDTRRVVPPCRARVNVV